MKVVWKDLQAQIIFYSSLIRLNSCKLFWANFWQESCFFRKLVWSIILHKLKFCRNSGSNRAPKSAHLIDLTNVPLNLPFRPSVRVSPLDSKDKKLFSQLWRAFFDTFLQENPHFDKFDNQPSFYYFPLRRDDKKWDFRTKMWDPRVLTRKTCNQKSSPKPLFCCL